MERKTKSILIGTISILAVLFAVSFPYIFATPMRDVKDLKIKVLTDKSTYEKGETVKITSYIVNDKIVAVIIGGGFSLGMKVEDENGQVVYGSDFLVEFIETTMPPNSQIEIYGGTWGAWVSSGNYTIIVFLGGFRGETVIQIV